MRYLVLAGYAYYPAACDDIVGVCPELSVAIKEADEAISDCAEDNWLTEWAQVYDLVDKKLVYKIGRGYGVRGLEDED